MDATISNLQYLRSSRAVRERAQQLLALAEANQLTHFTFHPECINPTVKEVVALTLENYPTLNIPYHSRWTHFDVGGVPRTAKLRDAVAHLPREEQRRVLCEKVIISVLLDAGAGPTWRFLDTASGKTFSRSEGLALASLAFLDHPVFTSSKSGAARPGGEAPILGSTLARLTERELSASFQVDDANRLDGLAGRATLLRNLGAVVQGHGTSGADPAAARRYFGSEHRLGCLADAISLLVEGGRLAAPRVLSLVLEALAPIWPGRIMYQGNNLGDVWHHRRVVGQGDTAGLVPLHKLSQWLTYSLLEPFEWSGIQITELDGLTGLAEYRNGGLLLDSAILRPREAQVFDSPLTPDHELVVEWRSLTIAIIDLVADAMRRELKLSAEQLPLAKVLQGGTWALGRKKAFAQRADGSPPLRIVSDGTVF